MSVAAESGGAGENTRAPGRTRTASRRCRAWPLAGAGGLLMLLLLGGTGCAAVYNRDYGRVPFQPARHFHVQLLYPTDSPEKPINVGSLLVLPPVGNLSEEQENMFFLSLWQELQQILPGAIRAPKTDGPFAGYIRTDNIFLDDGRMAMGELERIGRLANTSHLLVVRIVEYRPYHPQRIAMEWSLLDVEKEQIVLIMVGGLDAAEQKVLVAADGFLRSRRARPYNTGNLDLLLRSPREYSGFAMAQAVDALKGRVRTDIRME